MGRLPGLIFAPVVVARRVRGVFTSTGQGHERRPVRTVPGRAYLPVRGVHRTGGERVADAVQESLEAVEGVHWAAVNPVLAEVAIAFDDGQVDVDDLTGIVDSVEDAHGLGEDDIPADVVAHPADPVPLQRGLVSLIADAAGVGMGLTARFLHVPRLPVEVASAIPAIDSLTPIRRLLETRPGMESAAVVTNAVLQGLGQGPLGLLVDGAHRASLLAELAARRRAWLAAEARLHPGRPADRLAVVEVEPRPRPLPRSLVETYGQAASLTSLAGAGLTLAATRNPQRSADVLLAGVPRTARLGLEGFASQLGRILSDRSVVPMDPRVLRHLDRIDTVVLDARTVTTGSLAIRDVAAVDPEDTEAVRAAARALFDPRRPDAVVDGEGWTLAPAERTAARFPRGWRTRAREMAGPGTTVLGLTRGGSLAGLVTAQPEVRRDTAHLVTAVRRVDCQLVVAGARSAVAPVVGADQVVPGGDHLARSVRALQADGRVVAVVSSRPGTALRAADCGIGVLDPDEPHPPWGAHLLCLDLRAAASVVDGVRLARTASRQAVAWAAVGSTAATVLALPPVPGAGRRAVTATQLSTLGALATGTWTASRLPAFRPSGNGEQVRWDTLDPADVLGRLGSGPGGLTAAEAAARWTPPVEARPPGIAGLVLSELANPLSLILGAGAALSAAVGSVADAGMIAGVLGLDALVGGAERARTEAAIGRLTSAVTARTVRVVRDRSETVTSSDALVVGDVVELAAGDAVPADCRVIDAAGLEADESSLTGESLPVAKDPKPVGFGSAVADRHSMLYAGTAVAAGRGTAVVVATGADTEARQGDTALAPPATGVQARLRQLTDITVPVVLASGGGLALNSLLRGRPAREAVASGVSLAAAAVPEGLPFVATVAQASAARRLAARAVLVRNPSVLEALGRVDVLCFDKTGTLTEGHLRLRRVSDGGTDEPVTDLTGPRRAVLAAALRATPRPRGRALAHPTDQAIVDGAATAAVRPGHAAPGWRKTASLPFEPSRAYHAVLGKGAHGPLLSVKGAPEVILPRCATWRPPGGAPVALDADARARAEREVERLARQGLRVLAVAERPASDRTDLDDERVDRLELLGFVGVADVARPTAAAPLEQLWRAGINCVMVTGDHPSTAEAIATDLGLLNGRRVLSGPELDELDDEELQRIVGEVAVFARVAPADKVRIVSAFQRAGRVVAMTGDGANDAQAIRMAEIGVAFGPSATAAARDAADLVVTEDDLNVLIDTVIEGRAMWASVRDALALLLGGNLGEVVFTTGAALMTGQSPLAPRQLLAVNLFTDLAPAMALAVSPPRTDRVQLAREGPETSLAGPLTRDVTIRATATAAGTYGAWLAARLTGTPTRARTVALTTLVGTQLGQTLLVGRRSPLVAGTGLVSAAGLVAIVQTPGLSQFFDCRPIGPVGWTITVAASALSTAAAAAANALLP